jgi:PhnB protein
MAKVNPIPEGYHTLTPHLIVRNAGKALDFYKKAFGAEEIFKMPTPEGKIGHAELKIGDSILMMCDEWPGMASSPQTVGGTSVTLHLYVQDVDTAYKKAIAAGCTSTMPVQDMFWGDRYGKLKDPFGHEWSIATHKQDLTPAQIAEGAKKAFSEMGKNCG